MDAKPPIAVPILPLAPLPLATGSLPGTGGQLKSEVEDFEVEELPRYLPCGEGDHLYLWIEKRDLPSDQLVRHLSRALGVPVSEIGTAGSKDRRAVTRQWVSVPRIAASRLTGVDTDRVRVLDAKLHRNKLRTGHLAGNRFRIVLRETAPGGLERAQAKAALLASRGMPNFYGEQRMGRGGSTLAGGWALCRGEDGLLRMVTPDGASHTLDLRDRHLRRLAASALQSEVFNRTVALRLGTGRLRAILDGDVCEKCDSGAPFVSDDPHREQLRFEAREIVPTGPMWGPKMRRAERAAGELEASVLEASELVEADFSRLGSLAEGTRRAALVWPGDLKVESDAVEDAAIVLSFSLPAGSYATVLVDEVRAGRSQD